MTLRTTEMSPIPTTVYKDLQRPVRKTYTGMWKGGV